MTYWVLDEDHHPRVVDQHEWLAWRSEFHNQIVEKTDVNNVQISTVFLGLDHQFGEGPPLLFETLVFGGVHDELMFRYSTWDEAKRGHDLAVDMVLGSLGWRKYLSMPQLRQLVKDILR